MQTETTLKMLTPGVRKQIIKAQRTEITEYHIYKRLARKAKNQKNRNILNEIAEDELRHYKIWEAQSGREVAPGALNIRKFYWISRILGLTFGLKLMERGEERAQINFFEMVVLSTVVGLISFGLGYLARVIFGIEV
jgi:rubrerythrin